MSCQRYCCLCEPSNKPLHRTVNSCFGLTLGAVWRHSGSTSANRSALLPAGECRSVRHHALLVALASGARADSATVVPSAAFLLGRGPVVAKLSAGSECRFAPSIYPLRSSERAAHLVRPRVLWRWPLRLLVRGQAVSRPGGSQATRWRASRAAFALRAGSVIQYQASRPVLFASAVLSRSSSSLGRARGTERRIPRGSSQIAVRMLPNKGLQRTTNSLFQSTVGGILAANASAEALLVSAVRCR